LHIRKIMSMSFGRVVTTDCMRTAAILNCMAFDSLAFRGWIEICCGPFRIIRVVRWWSKCDGSGKHFRRRRATVMHSYHLLLAMEWERLNLVDKLPAS
jgi:hypothetical protein